MAAHLALAVLVAAAPLDGERTSRAERFIEYARSDAANGVLARGVVHATSGRNIVVHVQEVLRNPDPGPSFSRRPVVRAGENLTILDGSLWGAGVGQNMLFATHFYRNKHYVFGRAGGHSSMLPVSFEGEVDGLPDVGIAMVRVSNLRAPTSRRPRFREFVREFGAATTIALPAPYLAQQARLFLETQSRTMVLLIIVGLVTVLAMSGQAPTEDDELEDEDGVLT